LDGVADITKNIVLATVGMVFIIAREDVCHPWKTTSEPLEHKFGDTHSTRHEFMANEFVELNEKVECSEEAIASGDLNAS